MAIEHGDIPGVRVLEIRCEIPCVSLLECGVILAVSRDKLSDI